jgi:hypothetical protein
MGLFWKHNNQPSYHRYMKHVLIVHYGVSYINVSQKFNHCSGNLRFICIETREKKFCEDLSTLGYPIFMCKICFMFHGPNLFLFQIAVDCIQNDRLGHTVSTKQLINLSEFIGLRYRTKLAEI